MDEIVEKIRARIAGVDPNGPRKVPGVFLVNVKTADGVKTLTIDLKQLQVSDESTETPDVTLDIDEDSFVSVANRELPFEEALDNGKAQISGNMELAAALEEVMKNQPCKSE